MNIETAKRMTLNVIKDEAKVVSDQSGRITDLSKANLEDLKEILRDIGCAIDDFKSSKRSFMSEVRGMRIAVKTEASQMIAPLQDIREFFLGKDHQEEIKRLTEFVELCERLEKLKKTGFLDTVADTMLKLA